MNLASSLILSVDHYFTHRYSVRSGIYTIDFIGIKEIATL